ncbi:10095_t:CDS:2 [Acaulospora morrowiae]|uniref:10095_t:CDS:1 n=1 Tax=Acaulospora morrowiae TaxID=94023 RepID=A0A9N9ADF2_9GLOM|nr:10095_t:CDS:2 [Acaulospora morrowiae]
MVKLVSSSLGSAQDLHVKYHLKLLAHSSGIWSACWSPIGNVIATGSLDKTIKVWDPETGDYYRTLQGHNLAIMSLDIESSGQVLVSISLDNTIKKWDVNNGGLVESISVKPGEAWSVHFAPDGQRFAVSTHQGMIKLYDTGLYGLNTAEQATYTSEGKFGLCVRFVSYFSLLRQSCGEVLLMETATRIIKSPDGKYLALGTENGCIYLFDVETTRNIHKYTGHTGCSIRTLDFTPNSSLLLSGSDDETIDIYDVRHSNHIAKFTGHDGYVLSVAAGDNTHFVSGSTDGKVKLWDIGSRQCLSTVGEHKDQARDFLYRGHVWGIILSANLPLYLI